MVSGFEHLVVRGPRRLCRFFRRIRKPAMIQVRLEKEAVLGVGSREVEGVHVLEF